MPDSQKPGEQQKLYSSGSNRLRHTATRSSQSVSHSMANIWFCSILNDKLIAMFLQI
jgi:hypothetical protein